MDLGFANIEWQTMLSHLVSMGIAYVLAFPLGWNRERDERSAGLRTFPLVAVASCGYILAGISVMSTEELGRLMAGVITGMGFIGGGAILKSGGSVRGTATAASLWNTGAIGVTVALGRFEIALVLALVNFLTLQFVTNIKAKVDSSK